MISSQDRHTRNGPRVESSNLHTPPGLDLCFIMTCAGRLNMQGDLSGVPFHIRRPH